MFEKEAKERARKIEENQTLGVYDSDEDYARDSGWNDGEVVGYEEGFKGWVCRTMIKSIEERRKYLYNEGFSRATTLVGNYGTKDYVFVVEGYMDRLKFVQFGEDNVVAILGWKISPQQIQKLKDKGITKIISALDNDDCGKRGTEFLKKSFKVTRFTYLKGIKDPGEMTQESFNKMFKRTMKIFNQENQGGN